jgi:hypothetical protein
MERLLHLSSIPTRARTLNFQMDPHGMIEQSNGILPRVAGRRNKLIQYGNFLALRCLLIAGSRLQ